MQADARIVREFLAAAGRRLAVVAALEGAAGGLIVATALLLVGLPARASGVTPLGVAVVAALAAVAIRLAVTRPRRVQAAHEVERRAPRCRNLLLTAEELLAPSHVASAVPRDAGATLVGAPAPNPPAADAHAPSPTSQYVAGVVMARAAALIRTLAIGELVPVARPALIAAATAVAWTLVAFRATDGTVTGRAASPMPQVDFVDVTIVSPPYAARAPMTLRDPQRIEVLQGSTVTFTIASNAATVAMTTADDSARQSVSRAGDRFVATLPVATDGFVSFEPAAADGSAGGRRLIGVTAVEDAPPRARIVAPGRDLVLADGRGAIDVRIEATDDVALSAITLRYTRVRGSGERYEFVEGEVPVAVRRRGASEWVADVRWALDSLALEPGDLVVYRAVVHDTRPGGPPGESDAFIAEVAAPGGVAAAGFALDPEEDRYALSQQMVIQKTERVAARRRALTEGAWADSTAAIATEQRRVRAEFVFMMGGEVADGAVEEGNMTDLNEEEEAAAEADLLAGREANAGRIALRRATRAMSRAAGLLDEGDAAGALVHERTALRELEQAFARNRIILRALAERDDLDPSRRLTGTLSDVARTVRAPAPVPPDAAAAELRAVLRALGDPSPGDPAALAERVLRLDPASRRIQEVAAALTAVSAAGGASARRAAMVRASLALSRELRTRGPSMAGAPRSVESAVLGGAVGDAARGAAPGAARGRSP